MKSILGHEETEDLDEKLSILWKEKNNLLEKMRRVNFEIEKIYFAKAKTLKENKKKSILTNNEVIDLFKTFNKRK
jgi:hypothetical protein